MKKKKDNATDAASLRQKAEERLKKQQSKTGSVSSQADMQKLIHELEVHQIELEMQNEELVIAKEKAEIAEEKYTALYDFAPSGYLSITKEGKITELNFAAAKMLGKERLRLQNSLLGFFISAETKPAYNRFLEKVFSSKTKETCEVTIATKENAQIYVAVSGIVSQDDETCLLTLIDITERKQIENELEEKTSFLSTIMDTSPVGIVTVDKTGNITYANNRAEQILGLEKEEITSRTYDAPLWKSTDLDGSPLPDEKQPFNIVKKSLKTVLNIQHGITWPDGTVVILSVNAAPIKDHNGEFNGMLASIEDITERKRAEDELNHSHSLMKYIIEHTQSAIAVHDRGLKYIYVSQRYLNDFKVKDKNIIGKHHYEVFPDLPQKWRDVHQKALAGEVHSAEEDPFYREDGSVYWTRWECRPWYESDGSIGGIIIYTEVINERKQREQLLTEQKELLTAIYRNAPLVMMVVNKDRRIQQINGFATQFANRDAEEMLGLRGGEALRCMHVLDDPEGCGFGDFCQQCVIRNSVLDTLETGETHLQLEAPYFYQGEDKHIQEMTLLTSTTPIMVKGERMVLVTLQDITNRKQAEEALEESELTFRKLFEDSSDAILLIDENNAFAECNQATLNFLKMNREQFLFLKPDDISPEFQPNGNRSKETAREMIDLAYEKGHHRFDLTHVDSEGGKFIVDISLMPIVVKGKTMLHTTWRNITDRKRAEMIKQLQYNIAQATITTRNLNELFDSIKNELNNMIDAKNFVIAFYNEETGMLSANVDRDEKGEIPEWPAEKSLTGYVIKQNRPVLLQKNEILSLYEEGIIELHGTMAETWLSVPLKVEGKILGAVVIQNYDNPDVYDQTSIEIMELVAHELSMFIDRQQSEEKASKLSRAVEQSSVSVMITNREGAIEYVNPFFTELTGYSFEEVKGKNPRILKSGHQPTAFYQELWDTILSGNDWEGELLNKKKSGEFYWEKAVISSIVNSEGVITNFVGIKEDITERKKAEKELQIKNRISSIFIHSKQEGFYKEVLDIFREFFESEYGFFGYINEEGDLVAESMTKDVYDECRIKDKSIIFPRDKWGGLWGDALNKKKTLYQNGNLQFPEGHVQLQNAIAAPIIINNKLIGEITLGNKQDNFNEKDKQSINNLCEYIAPLLHSKFKEDTYKNDLLIAKEKAQESDKLKTAFINNISHEIRTPLNGILGFGNLLLTEKVFQEDKKEMLEKVQQSSDRLMNTITNYMDMARIVSNTLGVNKKEFSLQPFFEEVIEETKQLCNGKKIGFEADYPDQADLTLDSDPELIRRILNIFLDNALKFTDQGSIRCGYKLKEDFIEFFVQDTGKGIAPEKREAIFNMFTQEDPSYKLTSEGSGLGLSIGSGLVKLLEGEVSVSSKPGQGSTFAFTLPYTETERAEKAPAEQEKNEAVAGKPIILLAEDEESNYLYMEVVLKKAGFDYLLAVNGEEAVAFCEQYSGIALVLMDIKMPLMNGLEATKRIREFRPKLPIIATTAYAQIGDEQSFLAAGCDGYLPKPIKKEQLLELFQKYVK